VGTALEVETEMNAIGQRLFKTAAGDAEDPVYEDHQYRDNEACFAGQILAHLIVVPSRFRDLYLIAALTFFPANL
jgi:hypothetical protein